MVIICHDNYLNGPCGSAFLIMQSIFLALPNLKIANQHYLQSNKYFQNKQTILLTCKYLCVVLSWGRCHSADTAGPTPKQIHQSGQAVKKRQPISRQGYSLANQSHITANIPRHVFPRKDGSEEERVTEQLKQDCKTPKINFDFLGYIIEFA